MKKWLEKYKVLPKALAVLLAIVLWMYVVTVVDPISERTISDIKPTYVGSEELLNTLDLRVGNTLENLVEVKLKGSRQELSAVDDTNIKVEVDVSKLSEAGEYELSYKVVLPSNGITVVKRKPDRLKIKLDKTVTASIPIRVTLEGSIAEGYIPGEARTIPSTLSAVGLAEEVNSISYAQVVIGGKDLNTSLNQTVAYTLHDEDGNQLDLKSVQIANSTVDVTFPVLKTKTIPLSLDIIEGGGVERKNVNYEITPSEITIAGEEKIINSMDSFVVSSINMADYGDDNKVMLKQLQMPDGIKNISGETGAEVKVSLTGLSYKTIETNLIEINNIPNGCIVSNITEKVAVRVRGSKESVDKIKPENIRIVIDLAGRTFSTADHPVIGEVYFDNIENVGAVGNYEVMIRVSK